MNHLPLCHASLQWYLVFVSFIFCSILLCLSACTVSEPPKALRTAKIQTELGLFYLEKGDKIRAKTKLLRAAQLAPHASFTHDALAFYWETLGDLARAELEHQKAIQLNPKGPEYHHYGVFLCRIGSYQSGQQMLKKALQDENYLRAEETYKAQAKCGI